MHFVQTISYRFNSIELRPLALPALFCLLGLVCGSWASRIPALSEALQISYSSLSGVLMCGGAGALASHWVACRSMALFGSRNAALHTGLGLCASLWAIGCAPTVPALMVAVLLMGVTSGSFSVVINAIGSAHEKKTGVSRMARLYALCCAGSLAGALLGGVMASMDVTPATHFLLVAHASAWVCRLAFLSLEVDDGPPPAVGKLFSLPRGPMLLLGLLGLCGSMAQNAIADWSAMFMKAHFCVDDSVAPLALSIYTVTMLLSRLAGDRLKERFGARRLVAAGGTVAALGLLAAVCAPHLFIALGGFALVGVGLSLLFPFVFSAAGQQGVDGTAGVAGMCNIGVLAGPPLMGVIAQQLGMQGTMGFIGLLSLVIACVAAHSGLLK